jgi:hypothetical protein
MEPSSMMDAKLKPKVILKIYESPNVSFNLMIFLLYVIS